MFFVGWRGYVVSGLAFCGSELSMGSMPAACGSLSCAFGPAQSRNVLLHSCCGRKVMVC